MTKQDLIDHLTYSCGLHRSSAINAVEGIVNAISDALAQGDSVYIRGFATIKPITLAARKARNITAGTEIDVPERRSVKLIPSNQLKNRMNNGK